MDQGFTTELGDADLATLTSMGYDVLKYFNTIVRAFPFSVPQVLDIGAARNEYERFDLWAVNLGLYQTGHGSLDYRLRDSETVWKYTKTLLLELRLALERVLAELKTSVAGPPFPESPQQPSSGANTPHDEGSEEEDYLDDYNDESVAFTAQQSVSDSIDRLFKLSMKLRNPTTRQDLSSADSYEKRDPDTGEDLMLMYKDGDFEHVKYTVARYRRQATAQAQNCDVEELDVHALSRELEDHFLVKRLANANTRRRRRLGFWSNHRLNLSRRAEAAKLRVEDENLKSAVELPNVVETAYTTPTKATTATHLDVSKVDITDNRSVVSASSYIVPEKSIEDQEDGIDVPQLPSSLRDDNLINEFECPYCFTICSRRFLHPSAWRTHVMKDLRPYVCTKERCSDSEQQFDSYIEWVDHENTAHDSIEPASNPQQSPPLPATTESGAYTSSTAVSARLETLQQQCPLCLNKFYSRTDLHSHLALHLQRIAIFSLPRFSNIEDGEDDDDAKAKAGSEDVAVVASQSDQMAEDLKDITEVERANLGKEIFSDSSPELDDLRQEAESPLEEDIRREQARRQETYLGRGPEKGKDEDASPEVETQQDRIARMAAARVHESDNPAGTPEHDDYSTFFVPKDIQLHLKEYRERAEREDNTQATEYELVPIRTNVFDPDTYRPFGLDVEHDPTMHPWPVPLLGLIEETPPGSQAQSVQGDISPVIEPTVPGTEEHPEGRADTGSKVSWGEQQTHVYEVRSPEYEQSEFTPHDDAHRYTKTDGYATESTSPETQKRTTDSLPEAEISESENKFGPFTYRPSETSLHDDAISHPWPVPKLQLIEGTLPESPAQSVQGDPSSTTAASKAPEFSAQREDGLERNESTESKVTWGDHDTYIYEVPSPEGERPDLVLRRNDDLEDIS